MVTPREGEVAASIYERHDNVVADLRTRLKLKEGERDQRIDELVRLVKNLPGLSCSTITAPMLGAYVFDIAVVCKSIFETQQVRFTRDSAARIAMEPLEEAYQEAEKSALVDKREYLSSCFVDVNKLLGKKAGDRMFLVDGSADRQGKPGMFTLWPWIHRCSRYKCGQSSKERGASPTIRISDRRIQ